MDIKNWRDWFVPPDTDPQSEFNQDEIARIESGVGHRDGPVKLKRKLTPRCAKCKRWMGYDDGMYVMLTAEWRVHIGCFNEVLQRHFEKGEAINMETGAVVKVEQEDNA